MDNNYGFSTGLTADNKFVAHRSFEPAFLVERHTEEEAVSAALDIVADYIRKFILEVEEQPEEINTNIAIDGISGVKSYNVKVRNALGSIAT